MKVWIERGMYNEIHSKNIGRGTIISGWTYIGKNVHIGEECKFGNRITINDNVRIGNRVNIQDGTIITEDGIIGDDVFLGANVMFVDEKYPTSKSQAKKKTPIVVGNNAIIGTNVNLVCCKIGKGAVIGTGSTVLSDVPDNEVWVGTPAIPIALSGLNTQVMTRRDFEKKFKTTI